MIYALLLVIDNISLVVSPLHNRIARGEVLRFRFSGDSFVPTGECWVRWRITTFECRAFIYLLFTDFNLCGVSSGWKRGESKMAYKRSRLDSRATRGACSSPCSAALITRYGDRVRMRVSVEFPRRILHLSWVITAICFEAGERWFWCMCLASGCSVPDLEPLIRQIKIKGASHGRGCCLLGQRWMIPR